MRRRLARYAVFALVLAMAAWVRLSNLPVVLAGGEALPDFFDGDPSYHLRRILETLRQFPRTPHFDRWMNWPAGAFCPWADGFDLGGAAWARILGGGASGDRVVLAADLWPVALGLLVVLAAMEWARRLAPDEEGLAAAAAAGVVAALLPQAVSISRFGRIDHHVLEALFMLLLGLWVQRRARQGGRTSRPLRFEVAGALTSAGALWVFTGSILYVGLAAAALIALELAEPGDAPRSGAGAFGLLAGAAIGALLSWPAAAEHRRYLAFGLPSLLQPVLLAGMAGALLLAAELRRRFPARRWLRAGAWLAGVAAAAACSLVAARPLLSELRSAVSGWLLHQDAWLATVTEFQPLFGRLAPGGGLGFARALFGWMGFLFPVVLPLAGWRVGRRDGRAAAVFTGLGAALLLLTLIQARFGRVLVPFEAVGFGLLLAWGLGALLGRWRAGRALLPAATLAAALLLACSDGVVRKGFRPAHRDLPDPVRSAALDLRAVPAQHGGEGVLGNWSFGHQLSVVGGRPVVVNGFGSYLDPDTFWESSRVLGAGEAELIALMERRRVGVLVTGAMALAGGATFPRGTLSESVMSGAALSPLLIAGSGIPNWNVKHLEHLMPVFGSEAGVGGLSFRLPLLWTYERVRGARLAGTAAPGARVVAELPFRERGQAHVFKAWGRAGADGSWELTVPLPTAFVRPTLWTGARWTVTAGGAAASVEVPERAVRAGSRIAVAGLPSAP